MHFKLNKRITFFQVPPYKKRWMATVMALGLILLATAISFYIVDFRVRPTLRELAKAKAKQIAIQAINDSIRSNISPNILYQNLIALKFKSDGKVGFIQPNTGEINRIASEATLAVQNRLKDLPVQTIKIPFGQVFGSRILAGYGPSLPVKVLPIGLVESSIFDLFDQAGINQTRHRIFLRVKAIVKMVVPLVNEEIAISTDIPLTEALIVGDVPNIYIGNGGLILPGNAGIR